MNTGAVIQSSQSYDASDILALHYAWLGFGDFYQNPNSKGLVKTEVLSRISKPLDSGIDSGELLQITTKYPF